MAFGYPVSLELRGRRALVVGEEAVAQGKVEPLLRAGATLTVIAEGPPEALARLEAQGVTVLRRGYLAGDLDGAFLCVAATEDPATRAALYREGRARGVLVNVMDDPAHCDFAAPAVVRRGDLTIAVSTGGRSPALARRVRMELEERFDQAWSEVVEVVGEVRDQTLPELPDLRERARRWEEALDLLELEALVRAGRGEEARARLRSRLTGGGSPRGRPAPTGRPA